ncbi:AAA-like domain-containing protein [Nostoc sp.]|uniref:AAA-like domain-containing protein n=1 Tax=Nostoc sp. TaxID=1180 RepID=UPI002FFB9066
MSSKLQLESRLDDYWDEEVGSKVSCTNYFQGYLLEHLVCPFVLALNIAASSPN